MKTLIAQWQAAKGKRFLELYRESDGCYTYHGEGQGGVLGVIASDSEAIAQFEARQVYYLRLDFPSLKRVF